ncbi:hypothetical protein [Haloplasma contractile]|uniref:Uncharacterized protein n=1 Tax=Haloplasma contractile SSD-17B TaxID=1033810 RepID=U2FE97_9MOLU|nr:hypothetical protein [Haloplasma contractile]ERJ11290.1 hypothetical protein HLPCO_002730 [Haloplasma contractile SSD-17B]
MSDLFKVVTIIVLIPIDFYLFVKIGKVMFGSWGYFFECIKHDLTPDLYSLFKGRLGKDWASEARLSIFSFFCGIIIVVEVLIFMAVFSVNF